MDDLKLGNAQHIGAREYQEDAFGFSDTSDPGFLSHAGVLAVVADGMGGLDYGAEVSQLAVQRFIAAYQEIQPLESIKAALHRAAQAANKAVVDLSASRGVGVETGTTLCAAVVRGRYIHWISIGDSRAYRLSSRSLRQLSSDHVFGEVLDEMARRNEITSAQAQQDPQRSALTSFLGSKQIVAIGYGEEHDPLMPGEAIMLCTDGLSKALTQEEILAAYNREPQKLCDRLVAAAIGKLYPDQDNVTVAVLGRPGSAFTPLLETLKRYLPRK